MTDDSLAETRDDPIEAPARARAAPARPPLSDESPAPVTLVEPPTMPVMVSRALWVASFAAGVAAVVFAFIYRTTQIDGVRAVIVDLQPDAIDETVDSVTYIVFLASVVALLLVVLVEFALVRRMMARHGGARWVLLFMLVPHAAVAAIAESFLAFGDEGVLIAALIITEGVLAVVALVVSLLPAAHAWFRRSKSGDTEVVVVDAAV